jgi:hypothetical protein
MQQIQVMSCGHYLHKKVVAFSCVNLRDCVIFLMHFYATRLAKYWNLFLFLLLNTRMSHSFQCIDRRPPWNTLKLSTSNTISFSLCLLQPVIIHAMKSLNLEWIFYLFVSTKLWYCILKSCKRVQFDVDMYGRFEERAAFMLREDPVSTSTNFKSYINLWGRIIFVPHLRWYLR